MEDHTHTHKHAYACTHISKHKDSLQSEAYKRNSFLFTSGGSRNNERQTEIFPEAVIILQLGNGKEACPNILA